MQLIREQLKELEYVKFFDRHIPYRHRIGINMYQRILLKRYTARTMQKINNSISKFEAEYQAHPEMYMCFIGNGPSSICYVVMDRNGLAVKYDNYRRNQCGNISDMNYMLGRKRPILGTDLIGSMASVDFKETSWFGKYGRTIELPNEAELKTIMTHFDGQENFTLESTEKWAIAWGKTISAKYPDIYVESCDDAQIKMQMPLEWMVLNYKTSHLPLGSGRLEKEPVSRIVPADGSCTIFEHIGGYSTATVYVNENWSTALFKRYARMYDRSVKVLSDDEPNHRYCVPAGWLKLSPPSSRTQKHLREHSYT